MKVYVGNLNEKIAENDLKSLFSDIGELVSVDIIKDKSSGFSRGFAFVEFETMEKGQAAISKFNEHEINGKKIKVNEANDRKRR